MCGIAGIFAYQERALPVDLDELLAIRDAMAARGPDGAGVWLDEHRRVGLAHRRLAIIDLSEGGAQPMLAHDSLSVVTFNGEIYNYRELKAALANDYSFRSNSDTEVLLALYRKYGEDMVHHLRGMFAFAIWDAHQQKLFMARDPYGIKPLYFSDDGLTLRFASQVKALIKGDGIRLTPNPAGHVGFFIFGHIPEPHTLYREIQSLPAGASMAVHRGSTPRITRYFDITQRIIVAQESPLCLSDDEQKELVTEALQNSVAHHLIADVPIGVFLSSGIDSNVVAALVARQGHTLRTLTLGFDEFKGKSYDEVPLAEAQAKRMGALHSTQTVTAQKFFEFLPDILADMDQPTCDGINSWLISKVAADQGFKVCLSGLGGDELFGGYPSFKQIPKLVQTLRRWPQPAIFKNLWKGVIKLSPEQLVSPKYAALFDTALTLPSAYLLRRSMFLGNELTGIFDPQFLAQGLAELQSEKSIAQSVVGISGAHSTIVALESSWYMRNQLLRDSDWASMSHGLELRLPLVDIKLFETLLPLIVSERPPTKMILAAAAGESLKAEVVSKAKTGFATPVQAWLSARYSTSNRGLRGWCRAIYGEFEPQMDIAVGNSLGPRLTDSNPVVVYRIGQLGDTLVSLPALQSLRKLYPSKQIVLLTGYHPNRPQLVSAWDIIEPTKLLNGVMYYPVYSKYIFNFRTYFRLAKQLRKLNPFAIINLTPRTTKQETHRDGIFFRSLCGVKNYRALPPTGSIQKVDGVLQPTEPEWQRLLRFIDPGQVRWDYHLPLPRWAKSEAQIELGRMGNAGLRLFGIGPGSKMPAKRWPEDRYSEVGKQILNGYPDAGLIVLGGPEDAAIGEQLCGKWGERSINLAGKLSIFGAAAALERCVAYIGNDTGTMHIASIVGTPCVALFSARDQPGKWDPCGTGHQVLRRELSCSGCMLEECEKEEMRCLKLIEVPEVLQAVSKVSHPELAVVRAS